MLENVAERLGSRSTDDVEQRIEGLQAEVDRLRRDVERRQQLHAREAAGSLADGAREIGGVKVVARALDQADEAELKRVVDAVRQDIGSGVVVLGTRHDGRLRFVAGVTPDLTQRIRAGDIIKAVAREAGGGGGGRPDFATGGGTEPEKLEAALAQAFAVVEAALAS